MYTLGETPKKTCTGSLSETPVEAHGSTSGGNPGKSCGGNPCETYGGTSRWKTRI